MRVLRRGEPMRHTDQETAELAQDVIELSRALAALKRAHEQLRAAAERVLDSWDTDEDVNESHLALRAALDGTYRDSEHK
jgi:hypothetical protein